LWYNAIDLVRSFKIGAVPGSNRSGLHFQGSGGDKEEEMGPVNCKVTAVLRLKLVP